MVTPMPNAAMRVVMPVIRASAPADSAAMARKARNAGMPDAGEAAHRAGEAVAAEPADGLLQAVRQDHQRRG